MADKYNDSSIGLFITWTIIGLGCVMLWALITALSWILVPVLIIGGCVLWANKIDEESEKE